MTDKRHVIIYCPQCGEKVIAALYVDTTCDYCGTKVDIHCEQNIITNQYEDEYTIYIINRKPCLYDGV